MVDTGDSRIAQHSVSTKYIPIISFQIYYVIVIEESAVIYRCELMADFIVITVDSDGLTKSS